MKVLTSTTTLNKVITAGLVLCLLLVAGRGARAATQAITGLNYHSESGASGSFLTTSAVNGSAPFTNPADPWNMTFGGTDQVLDNVISGGNTYVFVRLADELRIKRIDNAGVTGIRDLVWCEGNPNQTPNPDEVNCVNTTVGTMEQALLGRYMNWGTDNIFSNSDANNKNNIERIDFIFGTGIDVPTSWAPIMAFAILERGGNDNFKIAPILSVDGNYNPTSYGPIVNVTNTQWGSGGYSVEGVVMRKDPAETYYRPSADLGAQNISGVLIPFSDLLTGPPFARFYGYSLFPNDVAADLVGLGGAILTTDGGTNGGLDLIEGGGFFMIQGGAVDSLVDISIDKQAFPAVTAAGQPVNFTITVENRSLGVTVVDAQVTDSFPANLTNISWTCQAFGIASSCNNGATVDNGMPGPVQSGNIADLVDISVGEKIVYQVAATVSPAAIGSISNTATVTANEANIPTPSPKQVEMSPSDNSDTAIITLLAVATGNKNLYFHNTTAPPATPNHKLSRYAVTTGTGTPETIASGSEDWVITPSLRKALSVNATSGLPIYLSLRRDAVNGNRTITVTLFYNDGISHQIGSPVSVTGDLTGTTLQTWLFNITDAGSFTIPLGATITARITITAGSAIRLYEMNGTSASRIEFNATTVINVDNMAFYNGVYPGGSTVTSTTLGNTVYIRAVVSDPFGFEDITGATLSLYRPNGTLAVSGAAMTSVATSGALRTYEYAYTIPNFITSYGTWTAVITAREGFEGTISHTTGASLVVGASSLPQLAITKVADVTTANPDGLVNYTLTVTNNGVGHATNVDLTDILSPFVKFGLVSQSGQPFTFTTLIGTFPSNFFGTPEYSLDGGPLGPAPATPPNYNGSITAFRIQMNGDMEPGAQFRIQYQVQVE